MTGGADHAGVLIDRPKPETNEDEPADTAPQIMQAARDAERAKDFHTALSLWQTSAARFGETRDTMMGAGLCWRETGNVAAAEDILAKAQVKFPDDAEIAGHYALIPTVNQDWLAASLRWRAVLGRFPDLFIFHGIAAVTCAQAGLHDIAEDLLRHALEREPNSLGLRIQHAIAAQYAEHWDDAVARWDMVLEIDPGNIAFQELRGGAVLHAKYNGSATALRDDVPGQLGAPAALSDIADIVSCFESLGDNCEFGLLQRKLGAEPAGLFRFSAVAPLQMIELLDHKLSLLGDPAHTLITEDVGELIIYDDRGYFWMHSGVRKGQMDEGRYLKQQSARMTLLKRKFIVDLEASNKIYICKESAGHISDTILRQLARRLNAYAANTLLGMRLADADNKPGSVRQLEPGIFIGYISWMFGVENKIIDEEGWKSVLLHVYQHRFGHIGGATQAG